MVNPVRRMWVVLGLMLPMWPALASAQAAPFNPSVAVGQTVWVTSGDGRVTKGRVQSVMPAAVQLAAGRFQVSIAAADVRRIQVRDSWRDGAAKGLVAGALVGTGIDQLANDCTSQLPMSPTDCNSGVPSALVRDALIGGGVGAVIGAIWDAVKLETVFEGPAGGLAVQLRPIVSVAGKGVGVRLRW